KLLAKLGWTLPEIDVVEVNEAFAAQVLACDRELKFDWDRTNVNGGAIALGHPIGMTGARIIGAVVHQLQRQQARRGLATLCISAGQGMAVALERVDDGPGGRRLPGPPRGCYGPALVAEVGGRSWSPPSCSSPVRSTRLPRPPRRWPTWTGSARSTRWPATGTWSRSSGSAVTTTWPPP